MVNFLSSVLKHQAFVTLCLFKEILIYWPSTFNTFKKMNSLIEVQFNIISQFITL